MAVHTTCLSETIGDDIPNILKQAEIPEGKIVIHVNTPSTRARTLPGSPAWSRRWSRTLRQPDGGEKKDQLNVIPGFVNPGDMREIRRIVTNSA